MADFNDKYGNKPIKEDNLLNFIRLILGTQVEIFSSITEFIFFVVFIAASVDHTDEFKKADFL